MSHFVFGDLFPFVKNHTMNLSPDQQKFKDFLLKHSALTEEQINELITYFKELHLAKGECFAEQDKHCNRFGFIVNGALYAPTARSNGKEYTHCFYEDNQLVTAYKSYHENTTSCRSIKALIPSALLVIDRDVLKNVLPPAYEKELLHIFLHTNYLIADEHAQELATTTARERFDKFMKNYKDVVGCTTKECIATYIGATREMLSRGTKKNTD
jgi:CRP-like cAMP-binding protein